MAGGAGPAGEVGGAGPAGRARLRLALWAQRRAHLVPAPVRHAASSALHRFAGGQGGARTPSEDWSVPLVPGRVCGDVEGLPRPVRRPAGVPAAPAAGSSAGLDLGSAAGPGTSTGRPIRCVIATDVLDVGGAQEFAAFLSRGLPRHGFEVTVVYSGLRLPGQPGPGGRLAAELAAEGVHTVRLAPDQAEGWLCRHRPDVISAHYAPDWLLTAAGRLDLPWVETLHGMHSFLHPDSWQPERRRARGIAAQIAVSELVRRQYLTRNPEYPAERVVTVPNGTDLDRVSTVDRDAARATLGIDDDFLFTCLARYCLQKNTYGLVAAFTEVAAARPRAHLLIAGRADDAMYFTQTLALAESSPYADRIHLRGHCANPAALAAAADVFVLDSFFEGWSLASMEALAVGTPVVLSDVGGAREQLTGGQSRGTLVANPGGDPERVAWESISELRFQRQPNRDELVAAMSGMVDGRERWAAARETIRAEAVTRFPAEQCLARHAGVLRAVALDEPLPGYPAGAGAAVSAG